MRTLRFPILLRWKSVVWLVLVQMWLWMLQSREVSHCTVGRMTLVRSCKSLLVVPGIPCFRYGACHSTNIQMLSKLPFVKKHHTDLKIRDTCHRIVLYVYTESHVVGFESYFIDRGCVNSFRIRLRTALGSIGSCTFSPAAIRRANSQTYTPQSKPLFC